MHGYYGYLALDIARQRTLEAERHRLARTGRRDDSRLRRLLRDIAGNIGSAFAGSRADEPASRPA